MWRWTAFVEDRPELLCIYEAVELSMLIAFIALLRCAILICVVDRVALLGRPGIYEMAMVELAVMMLGVEMPGVSGVYRAVMSPEAVYGLQSALGEELLSDPIVCMWKMIAFPGGVEYIYLELKEVLVYAVLLLAEVRNLQSLVHFGPAVGASPIAAVAGPDVMRFAYVMGAAQSASALAVREALLGLQSQRWQLQWRLVLAEPLSQPAVVYLSAVRPDGAVLLMLWLMQMFA